MLIRAWHRLRQGRGPREEQVAPHEAVGAAIRWVELGRPAPAIDALRDHLRIHPDDGEAWLWMARALASAHRRDEALEAFDEAAGLARDATRRALIEGERSILAGEAETAIATLERASRTSAPDPTLANQLALAYIAAGRTGEAIASLRAAIAKSPSARELHNSLGLLLGREGDIEAARLAFRDAVSRFPSDAPLHYNFALVLSLANRKIEAVDLYRRAIELDPQFHAARLNLALDLFLLGRLPEAFAEFESRWEVYEALQGAYVFPRERQWRGESLAGRRLLVWAEQGLGDTLQMLRYVPLLAARGAQEVHVRVPRALLRLAQAIPGATRWIAEDDLADRTPFDLHCPMLSLPFAFGTGLDNIPASIPYIHPTADAVARWAPRLPPRTAGRLRAGLVWHSGQWGDARVGDRRMEKSIPLDLLAPLAGIECVDWVCLQVGGGREEMPGSAPALCRSDPAADIGDFQDTAAILGQLDILVSVDTSVAHLAAAMGKPVLMMLKFGSGLFWLLDREDSPWYPDTLRIVRQESPGDWAGVIARTLHLIQCFVLTRSLWEAATP